MNIKNILLSIGSGLISSTPLGALALPVINALLPADKKLPVNATGEQATAAIKQLPPEEAMKIDLAEIQLQVEEERGRTSRYEAMCASDGQENRAKNVNKAMNTLIGLSIMFVLAIITVYIKDGAEAAFSYELVAIYGVVTSTFAYVVRASFGDLRTEALSRHQTIDEKPRPLGVIASLLNRKG